MLPLSLDFGSFLSYTPRPTSEQQRLSNDITLMLKRDEQLTDPRVPMSDFVAGMISSEISKLPFSGFFEARPILVPTPSSTLSQPGTLRVPQRLADALVRRGIGQAVVDCLKRVKPLRKAARCTAATRPTAAEHYDSFEVQKELSEPKEILLIDDVITRGATLVGAAGRLADAFPNARIRAFAAIRTISSPSDFVAIHNPCVGTIQRIESQTFRSP